MTKRLASMQDLSCLGRCSLAVSMSIVPAMGIETVVLPTAILSTHTAFDGFTFLDFTQEAERILAHWRALALHFDTIYIGYLGSIPLIGLAERFLSEFRAPDTRVILDPAFGDNGRLYTNFNLDYVHRIRSLCRLADVILPNVTEACALTGLDYAAAAQDSPAVAGAARTLLGGALQNVLITSCAYPDGQTGLCCVGRDNFSYAHDRLSRSCHGSGDLFASVLSGLMTQNVALEPAARAAADFTADCIRASMDAPDRRWYGIEFERQLPRLMEITRGLKSGLQTD